MRALRSALLIGFGLLLLANTALAQTVTYTWTGAVSGDWNNPANWSPQTVPGIKEFISHDTDNVVFGTSARTAVTIAPVPNSDYEIHALTFLSNAPNYTFTLQQNSNGAVQLYISTGVANQSSTTHPSFTITAVTGFTMGQNRLAIDSGGIANIAIANSSEVDLSPSTVSTGSASLHNVSGGQADLTGNAETLAIVNDARASVIVFDTTDIGSISGGGSLDLNGNDVTIGALNHQDTISGVISDSFGGGSLIKTGSGKLTLSNANTYAGFTTVDDGVVEVDGSLAGAVALPAGLSPSGKFLSGAGAVGDVFVRSNTVLEPGSADPNTKLSMNSLSCPDGAALVNLRIGDNGSSTYGTYLDFASPLSVAECASLKLRFLDAGKTLVVGQAFLIALMIGTTDYSASNLSYDFGSFLGYREAKGHFLVAPIAGTTVIYFILDDLGDGIFENGFELIN